MNDLDTSTQGSPTSCEAAATELRALARALVAAGRSARRSARIDTADFDGRTADAFRESCSTLESADTTLAEGTSDFAGVLTEYGARLAEIVDVLRRVRTTARAAGLRVVGTMVYEPTDDGKAALFGRLAALVRDTRAVQAHAEHDLTAAIERFAPDDLSQDILGLIEDQMDQPFLTGAPDTGGLPPLPTWPPPESAWPKPSATPQDTAPDTGGPTSPDLRVEDPPANRPDDRPDATPDRSGDSHRDDSPGILRNPSHGDEQPPTAPHAAASGIGAFSLARTGIAGLRPLAPDWPPAPPTPPDPQPDAPEEIR